MSDTLRRFVLPTALALAGAASVFAQMGQAVDRQPDGKGNRPITAPAPAGPSGSATPTGYGINYHGGPVMSNLNGVNVYYIWYGNWGSNTAKGILTDLITNIGPSPYFNINTTYKDSSQAGVPNKVIFKNAYDDPGTLTSLSDAQIKSIVSNAITGGKLPKDANGVYFVLTAANVTASSGFCTKYCGWHTHATIAGADIKYSFVGNPDRCPSSCAAQAVGPNENAGADGMASIIAHELEETASDPDLNAWYDSRGYENADKCAWTFGTTTTLPGGAKYNMTLGNRNYLIQQNWVNARSSSGANGYCAKSY